MKKNKKSKLICLLLLFVFVFVSAASFAIGQNLVYADGNGLEVKYPEAFGEPPVSTDTSLPDYVKYIFRFSIMIAGLIALASLVYGGISYLTSTGSPAKISDSKDQIFSAFLGLIILLCSYLILYTINPQLVQFQLDETKKIEIPEEETPPTEEEEKEFTFFQVPVGKIIERAILKDEPGMIVNLTMGVAQDVEQKSKILKELTEELKEETDRCKCGQSSCVAQGCYGAKCCGGDSCPLPKCNGSCPEKKCDKDKIKEIIEKIKPAIVELQDTQQQFTAPNLFLTNNLLEIEKAGILMSLLYTEVEDYNSMLTDKYFLEKDGIKVKFDYFSGWGDIKVEAGGSIVNDPATFYFRSKGNEEAIEIARELEIISSPSGQLISGLGVTLPSLPTPDLLEVPPGVLDVPFYSQRDSRWASEPMGSPSCIVTGTNTRCTIGSVGCLLTSISSSLTYMNFDWTPLDVSDYANARGYITPQANLLTTSCLDSLAKSLGFSYKKIYDASEMGQKPLVTYCKTFKYQWGHFIGVKGIKDGRVYINDPYWHIPSLSISEYNSYNCGHYYYAFWK